MDERVIEQQPKPERNMLSMKSRFIKEERPRVQGFEDRPNAIERGDPNSKRSKATAEPSYAASWTRTLLPFLFAQGTPGGPTPGD